MKCRLCLQERELLKKSHIIPKFFYRGLFGSDQRLVEVNLKTLEKTGSSRDGHYERSILCQECDSHIIGAYESYASKTLFRGSRAFINSEYFEAIQTDNGFAPVMLYQLDYSKLKLFFLSMLWKAHVSSLPFFKEVQLGARYSEQLRLMVFKGDPGSESEFQSAVFFMRNSSVPIDSVMQPRQIRVDGNTSYLLFMNRVLVHYNMSQMNKSEVFDKCYLSKDGQMQVCILEGETGVDYFHSVSGYKVRLNNR